MFVMTTQADYELLIVVTVLGTIAVPAWAFRRRLATRWRRVVLGGLAALAVVAHYGFFLWQHPAGIQTHDAFHYYLNSKYFPELGYFDLYLCTVAARAQEEPDRPHRVRIRNLRNPVQRMKLDASAIPPRCNRRFSPERWADFRADLRWFQGALLESQWDHVLNDHGYNPSPVWTLIGRPIASLFPAEDWSMNLLRRLDLILVLTTLGFVAWAFGFEMACLAALVWAVNPLTRYSWIGDAFLRYLWFASGVIGLCLLRRRRHLAAGMLLGLSALLRLFPIFFVAGYGLWQVRHWLRERRFAPGLGAFVLGGALVAVVLPTLAIPVGGRGPSVLVEFARNIGPWSRVTADNSVGLRSLLSTVPRAPGEADRATAAGAEAEARRGGARRRSKDEAFEARRPWFLAIVGGMLLLWWRGIGRARAWEAAALGFLPMLLIPALPAYYASCMVAPALLAEGRRRIGAAFLGIVTVLCLCTLAFWERNAEWTAASVVLLLASLYVLVEMALARAPDAEPPAP